jgi:hypothetical protein
MNYQFLYRALREEEINSEFILIPKNTDEFKSDPRFGIDMKFPIKFYCEENAVRQHQWQQNGFPTRGISTTPLLERAKFYAQKNKIIVKIDTSLFSELGIKTYDVNKILGFRESDIAVPEDNEIILVYEKDGKFPSEIIVETIKI